MLNKFTNLKLPCEPVLSASQRKMKEETKNMGDILLEDWLVQLPPFAQ